jgi:hypothetical protein
VVAVRFARGFQPSRLVIERGPLSGLLVRHLQKPLADMVICGQEPNPDCELISSGGYTGFPRPDLTDHSAHLGLRLEPESRGIPLRRDL